MEDVITIRVPKKVKLEMGEYDINWSEDLRKHIDARIKTLKLLKTMEKMRKNAKSMKVKVDSADIIRAYRDAR